MIGAMVPMRSSTIFKSRWMALIWAAGIIWFAYDFAGSAPQANASDNSAGAPSTDDSNRVAQILGS